MARTKANDSNVFKSKKGRLHLLATDKERAFDRKGSRVNRLETSDDAFGGDEDEYLGDLSDEDEIYGLELPFQDEDEDEDEDEHEDQEDEHEASPQRKQFKRAPVDDTNKGRFSKSAATADEADEADSQEDDDDEDSDEHDRAPTKPSKLQPQSDDDDDEADREGAQDSDDEETWAPGSYHASRRAPGEADSEDDEALELEEAEARRLQKKSKTALAAEDYGMDEDEDELEGTSTNRTRFEEEEEEEAATKANSAQAQAEWTEEKAIAHLLKHNPETLALLDDLARIAERIKVVEKALKDIRMGGEQTGEEHQALPIVELEHQALVTYLPTLTFYFSLLLSPHPSRELLAAVLARLSSLRTALVSMEELELTTQLDDDSDEEESADDQEGEGMELSEVWDKGGMQAVGGDDDGDSEVDGDEDDDSEEDLDADMAELAEADLDFDSDEFDSDLEDERTGSMLAGMEDAELEALMQEMEGDRSADALIAKVKEVQAAKKAGKASGSSSSKKPIEASTVAPPEFQKTEKIKKLKKQVVIPELPALSSAPSSRKQASRADASAADDYLDPTSLTHGDSTDKASTRHSLRFHVSQVSQKERRRNEGNGRRVGGDDDLPRRSKENARREVLKRQQHGVATSATGAALDDDDWGEDDLQAAQTVRGTNPGEAGEGGKDDGPSGLDYYDQVEADSKAGRQAKKAKYDEERQAEKEEIMSLADSSVDGPRGATRTIMANKGLTPRRSKASRNSRVKKRLQYDKALKKVASMKAVYKGGDRSNYEGERSGIGKNTVKSVRLNK